MSKYISEEAFEAICYDNMFDVNYKVAMKRFEEEAVDVEQVRHGAWIRYGYSNKFDCSICGFTFTISDYKEQKPKLNYCPHCGAKMEEEEQEDA